MADDKVLLCQLFERTSARGTTYLAGYLGKTHNSANLARLRRISRRASSVRAIFERDLPELLVAESGEFGVSIAVPHEHGGQARRTVGQEPGRDVDHPLARLDDPPPVGSPPAWCSSTSLCSEAWSGGGFAEGACNTISIRRLF